MIFDFYILDFIHLYFIKILLCLYQFWDIIESKNVFSRSILITVIFKKKSEIWTWHPFLIKSFVSPLHSTVEKCSPVAHRFSNHLNKKG